MPLILESDLRRKYPPSSPCDCDICRAYCSRPGWWTVSEAERALRLGYARRMMLEISPERDFGVLSPAFRGNEGRIAFSEYSTSGCTFHSPQGCELFGTDVRPLECRFCHHDRHGRGYACHRDIERLWRTRYAQQLVGQWSAAVING